MSAPSRRPTAARTGGQEGRAAHLAMRWCPAPGASSGPCLPGLCRRWLGCARGPIVAEGEEGHDGHVGSVTTATAYPALVGRGSPAYEGDDREEPCGPDQGPPGR